MEKVIERELTRLKSDLPNKRLFENRDVTIQEVVRYINHKVNDKYIARSDYFDYVVNVIDRAVKNLEIPVEVWNAGVVDSYDIHKDCDHFDKPNFIHAMTQYHQEHKLKGDLQRFLKNERYRKICYQHWCDKLSYYVTGIAGISQAIVNLGRTECNLLEDDDEFFSKDEVVREMTWIYVLTQTGNLPWYAGSKYL